MRDLRNEARPRRDGPSCASTNGVRSFRRWKSPACTRWSVAFSAVIWVFPRYVVRTDRVLSLALDRAVEQSRQVGFGFVYADGKRFRALV